jgi:two-component system phosphate regulon sensor histidine kinase PhoR
MPEQGLQEALLQSIQELTALKEKGEKILAATDQDETIRLFLEGVHDILRVPGLELYLYDEDGTLSMYSNPDVIGTRSQTTPLKPEQEVIEWVFKERKPSTCPSADGKFVTLLPLAVKAQRVGLLCADTTHIADTLSSHVLELLATLSGQAAISLMHHRLLSQVGDQVNLLNNILDSITNGIVTLDMQKRVTRINRNAMMMLELGPDQILNRPYKEGFPPGLAHLIDDMIQEMMELGYVMEQQYNYKPSQGGELPLAIGTSLLRDETLSIIGVIIVLRDMTASKELERLRRLDQLKSEFVANVSHDLKTPLTSIKAYCEALLDMVTDHTQKEFLKVIDEESDRLISMIMSLLNVSRIQSGRLKLEFTLVDPKSIVEEIKSVSKVQSERHRLIIEYAPELPDQVLLDKERMKEVMINLISNAIKYSPDGGNVEIHMGVCENNLKIDVKDYGMGIGPEHLPKIFDQFYRVDSSMTASISGTGLGLTIVKGIVEGHGGHIKVESQLGKGSTFTLLLPIRKRIKRGEPGFDLDESFAG